MKPRLKILFVCAMNQKRSLTAEHLYREDARLEVRSCGTRNDARRRLKESDLVWADAIFVMEREHKQWIAKQFPGLQLSPIDVLEIPDDFEYMEPALQEMLKLTLDPVIEHLVENQSESH